MKDVRLTPETRLVLAVVLALTLALLAKFFWTLIVYDVPLGYDPGFYRYLFVRHADAFPPFVLAELDPWARGHPLGLFFFTTILLRLGLPVDWLLGWIWNLFPVLVALSLAWVIGRREGKWTGVCVLIAALLSVAYFDGFAAMYWKTYASLFWLVWTVHALERRSWWSVPLGILTVATHHQTGFLFGLMLISWLVLPLIPVSRSTQKTIVGRLSKRDFLVVGGIGLLIFAIGLLWYLPVWQDAVLVHLPALLQNDGSASGSFPPASFYLRTSGILLLLGAVGWVRSVQRERWTLWQLGVLWSFLFVALRLFFYRRFFLQLDFFLLPFAAAAMVEIWHRFTRINFRLLLAVLIVVQGLVMQQVMLTRVPLVDAGTFNAAIELADIVPREGFVLGLENESVVVLRGWLPDHHVGGPGLFEVFWSQQQWESFLLGTHEDRVFLLSPLPQPTYLFVSALFLSYYGPFADDFLGDPCFEPTDNTHVYRVTCVPLP